MNKRFKAILIAVLVIATALLVTSCKRSNNPYETNDDDGYTVNVRYDANGGTFTTNTSVIVDSYSPEDYPSGRLPLFAPDDERRGDMAMTAKLGGGYFLAGWYTERTAVLDAEGNHLDYDGGIVSESGKTPAYVYSGHWDFENDRLDLNTLEGNTITLYAAWVPEFTFEFYDASTGELIGSRSASHQASITLPALNASTGRMEKKDFPDVIGKTYSRVYTDENRTQVVDTATVTHTGVLNLENATAIGETMKLYIDFLEGNWYWISTAEQLISNADPSAHYVIEDDLDFTGKSWPLSGTFTGSIQGNGHKFINVTAKQGSQSQQAGLFGTIAASASITDVSFENVSYTIAKGSKNAGPSYGLFAGRIIEGANLENVTVSGTLIVSASAPNGALSGNGDHAIGLVCGTGYEFCDIDYSNITVEGLDDDLQYTVNVSSEGNTVIWERVNK